MKRSIRTLAAMAGLGLASGAAFADDSLEGYPQRYEDADFAEVVHVEPVRRRVRVSEPVRECWQETRYTADGPFTSSHIGGTLLGSTIGVVLGNQVGHGRGKDVARVAGALIGGAIGHNVSVDRQRRLGDRGQAYERCDVRYRDRMVDRIDGYDVTYAYAGREYVTRMPYDPGERIRVRVDVSPAEG
jgi:uncharacterized protein YcfJ